MRDIPREIPIKYRLEILFSGSFFIIGLVFIMLGCLVLYFRRVIASEEWHIYAAIVLFLWGLSLIFYTIRKGWKKLKILTWGKMLYGKLQLKESAFKDIGGNVSYKAEFLYPYGTKKYIAELDILEAYNMDEGKYYLLVIDRDRPGTALCLEQFSERFIKFFINKYHNQAKKAMREQGLDR